MQHLNFLDWFETYFDNFSRSKSIGNSPAFGICYRARNFQSFPIENSSIDHIREGIPISYELSSHEDSSHDLSFITSLNHQLRKTFERGAPEQYHFKVELVQIPFSFHNKSEEFKNDLPASLYVFTGMTKEFYKQAQNKIIEKKRMDNLGASIINWSLLKEKDPLEIIFNYHTEEAPNELLRRFKEKDLDEFIRLHPGEKS
jgi:hypothetical protein